MKMFKDKLRRDENYTAVAVVVCLILQVLCLNSTSFTFLVFNVQENIDSNDDQFGEDQPFFVSLFP
jgi:hypothetical protein